MMLKTVATGVVLLTASTVASAADAPYPARAAVAPGTSWDGFYLGVNGGGGVSRADSAFGFSGQPSFGIAKNRLDGAFGGVQAGHRWSTGGWVLGLEADVQITGIGNTLRAGCSAPLCGAPAQASFGQRLSWFSTARGRLGYAFGDVLIYATGGYVVAGVETTATAAAAAASARASWTDTYHGWTVGGGAEVALSSKWSVRGEWLHFGFDPNNRSWATIPVAIEDRSSLRLNAFRMGLDYRF